MIASTRSSLRTALVGGLALGFATPPALFPGAELLVIVGLAAWFVIATASPRPLLHSYLLGCVHMAWFSWSVRHVLLPAYVAIVLLGGLYFLAASAGVRRVPERWRALAFAIASAASFWLRANMPEILYPHGQPCHDLWQWPTLLGSLTVGGEPLANALLAAIAVGFVQLWRSWRIGIPRGRSAWLTNGVVWGSAVVATIVGNTLAVVAAPTASSAPTVSIAAVEPGLHSQDPFEDAGSAEEYWRRVGEVTSARLVEPTRTVLSSPNPPDLVLWPESSWRIDKPIEAAEAPNASLGAFPLPAGHLVLGGGVGRPGRRSTPTAFVVELPSGRILGRHDKRRLVPGGEFLPLVNWLPTAVSDFVRDAFANALGSLPNCVPGVVRPPLRTTNGVPFGALLCYDNAFPGPAADQVAQGARFLCVLSNESWYRNGAELTQLVAMTVCRAKELATPLVRCTTDGWSCVVGADGTIRESLPIRPSPQPDARILRAAVQLGTGELLPMAWLRAASGPATAILLGLALLHGVVSWARLRRLEMASTPHERHRAIPGSGA